MRTQAGYATPSPYPPPHPVTRMFGFGKKKVISVQYIEAGKKSAFSQAKIPVEDLADEYEMDSLIQINGQNWTVVAADPNLKEDFAKSGKLQVFVSKGAVQAPAPGRAGGTSAPVAGGIRPGAIGGAASAPAAAAAAGAPSTTVDAPGEFLFSLATINDEIGTVKQNLPSSDAFEVHEDDWRQLEFISRRYLNIVRQEFTRIEAIHQQHRSGAAFKRMHVRSSIPAPLEGVPITKDAIEDGFRVTDEYRGVTITNYGGLVELSFALEAAEVGVLWGELDSAGQIAALNLTPPGGQHTLTAPLPEVTQFCAAHSLMLVDWLGMRILAGAAAK